MIFVIAAVFILVISFVVALVSLIKEQSKIEKENVASGKNDGQPKAEKFQAGNRHVAEPDLATLKVAQPQTQPQTQPQSPDFNALHLAEKPWWEKEIQKRGEESSSPVVREENINQIQQLSATNVLKTEDPSGAIEPESSFTMQTPQEESQNLQGSFSVSDLAKGDQES